MTTFNLLKPAFPSSLGIKTRTLAVSTIMTNKIDKIMLEKAASQMEKLQR